MAKLENTLKLANAEKSWQSVETQKKIASMYKDLAKQAEKEAQSIPGETVSQNLRTVYLDAFLKDLHREVNRLDKSIEQAIKAGMTQTSAAVVDAHVDMMKEVGLNISGAFSYVPTQVVESLVSGKIYSGDWTLSKSLWKAGQKTTKDVESIVAAGIAAQKPTYDIAKDIEKYLNPSARKPWDWSKVYPGTSLKVDYSAQRAARTLIQHSYQLSYRRTAQNNPFIEGFIWRSAHSIRTCELCEERDGTLYTIGHEPLDHPQGLCYLESYIPKSNEEIADTLADWVEGKSSPEFNKAMEKYVAKGYNIGKGTQKLKEKVESVKEQSKKWDVTKAETVKEVNDKLNDNKWFSTKCYLNGADLESSKQIYSACEEMFTKFPFLQGNVDSIEVTRLESSTYGNCRTLSNGAIMLNRSFFSDWGKTKRNYASTVHSGFHVEGTSAKHIITHELGHALDGYLSSKGLLGSSRMAGETFSVQLMDRVFSKTDESGEELFSKGSIGWKVSTYATKNEREWFAESITGYMSSPGVPQNKMMGAFYEEFEAAIAGLK